MCMMTTFALSCTYHVMVIDAFSVKRLHYITEVAYLVIKQMYKTMYQLLTPHFDLIKNQQHIPPPPIENKRQQSKMEI